MTWTPETRREMGWPQDDTAAQERERTLWASRLEIPFYQVAQAAWAQLNYEHWLDGQRSVAWVHPREHWLASMEVQFTDWRRRWAPSDYAQKKARMTKFAKLKAALTVGQLVEYTDRLGDTTVFRIVSLASPNQAELAYVRGQERYTGGSAHSWVGYEHLRPIEGG
jgi:hypothetical protein